MITIRDPYFKILNKAKVEDLSEVLYIQNNINTMSPLILRPKLQKM